MFNGIVESIGKVSKITPLHGGREIEIEWEKASELGIDDSISVEGVCQTVVQKTDRTFTVQAVEETLRKTSFDYFKEGDLVNLERSLTLNQRLDGHMVQGHVDTTGKIEAIEQEGADWLFTFSFDDDQYGDMVVGRGSIAIDGISLTVARLKQGEFTVAIIPYTYDHTSLQNKKVGDPVNLEFDIIGKYVVQFMQRREGNQ